VIRLGCIGAILAVLGAAGVVWVASSSGIADLLGADIGAGERRGQAQLHGGGPGSAGDRAPSRGRSSGRARPRRGRSGSEDDIGDQALSALDRAPGVVWRAVRIPLALGALVGLALLMARWADRRSRRYVRLTLKPFRAEQVESEEVRRLFEAWHQQLLRRWWRRIPRGQPSIALEVLTAPDRGGELEGRLSLVCPAELADSVEGALLGCYQDSTVARTNEPMPPVAEIVRLKKRRSFVHALRNPEEEIDERNPIDPLLNHMAQLGRPAVFQLTLTPTPAVFDRYSRWRFRAYERASSSLRLIDPSDPGLRSEVLREELKGGMRVQHRPLFFTDIRVAAASYRDGAGLAGTVRGESGAENRLVERYMRRWGRAPTYLRRLHRAVGNPLPGWRKSVFSSAELTGLWQFPGPGLKFVRLARSPVPRMPATPEVSRDPERMLMRDEHGPVGILPEDKTDGLGLIGGQKTGKTSVLCRTVRADALDPECAVIVLIPKPGDASKALSMVPPGRTVHHLDFERPEFGINPLISPGDPGAVADRIVDAFRDVHAEGDIRGSSDRYLRQAAQAAIGASRAGVVEGPPTLWHMYRILIPIERAFRERVVEALYLEPRFVDTAMFFGRELPGDLEKSPAQTTAKLDAPRNKLLRLMVESLDRVLRHPTQVSLDEIVRRREVLIVDGKMGTFGADNCRVMMQFILSSLYAALQRQQQLPEPQRVRVALKVDEAHLILNDSFADAMATLRSGGLEVVAAWQYGAQIDDPKIRSGMMSLLRQRCMFSMGEQQDARDISSIAMAAYTDMIRPDRDSRSLLRVTPDTIFNLPNHRAICSWICRGSRVPAFLGQTIPLESDETLIEHHAQAQRERGCGVPERLPDPLPDLDWNGLGDLPSRELDGGDPVGVEPRRNAHALPPPIGVNGNGAALAPGRVSEPTGADRSDELAAAAKERPAREDPGDRVEAAEIAVDFDPAATSIDDVNESPAGTSGGQPPPESYIELDLDDLRGLVWDKLKPLPPDRRGEPSKRDLEILAALWSYRFLFASQIWRRWWRGSSLRAAQQGLGRMAKSGWLRRFKFQLAERGAQQRVYCLTRQGFELAQQHSGRRGPYIDPGARWREPQPGDPARILRDLHVNGWVLAFQARAGKVFRGWRGPREGRLEPPRRKVRGEWRALEPRDVIVGANHKLRDFGGSRFEPVSPDATLELRITAGEGTMRFDLLVELDRARSSAASEDRLRRYDGLISGWAGMLDRYSTLGTPPMVVFVCEDEREIKKLVRIADRAMTSRLAKAGTVETEWPHPGRRAIFFVHEREIHFGSLEAVQLPEHPPELRARLGGRRARACKPRRVNLIEPKLIDLA
jgi:hypothetical protein